jgi:glutaminase
LGIQVRCNDGQVYAAAAANYRLPLMSVIKPFVLLYLLQPPQRDRVLDRIDTRPSTYPYNSIAQLELDRYQPRNPLINSGAIALAALLPGATPRECCEHLCEWLNQVAGSELALDRQMLASVQAQPNPINQAIAHLLSKSGYVDAPAIALAAYEHTSCVAGTLADLTKLGLLLAQPQPDLRPSDQRLVNALMLTCGLYEDSGSYAGKIGLPIKSGVSGGLLAIVPGAGAIAAYSPPLDLAGNSLAGLFAIEQLAETFNLSIFN